MPRDPIDPSSALKKLFERRAAGETTPVALFKSTTAPGPQTEKPSSPNPALPVGSQPKRVFPGNGFSLRQFGEMVQRFRKRSSGGQRVIGIDLGSSSVKVTRIEQEGPRVRLTGVALQELPMGISDKPEWDKLIRENLLLLKRKGLLNGPIVLGFHHMDSVVETVRLPKMPSNEIQQAVLWEARERLSLNPDSSVIRFLVTGELMVEGQPQLEVLIVSAPREELLAQWRILSELGLKVVAVEPVSLASFYSLTGLELWKSSELVGLLEIGMKASHLSFIRGQSAHFSRFFQVAGDSFTRSIADYCQVTYDEAEQMKRQHGISKMALEEDRQEAGHAAEDRVRVSHALGLHMEQLVAEIEQSYRYFAFELGGSESQKMDRLIITGGGGLLKNLPEFLTSRLSIPISMADPIRGIQADPSVQDLLGPDYNQRLTVSLGLALRSLGG